MGLGIKTALLRPLEPLWLYRLPGFRLKYLRDASQYGEGLLLNRYAPPDCPQFIVDVGANDGLLHSNSYFFVQRGWKAILVEPHPVVFRRLTERYAKEPNVICENLACSNVAGNQELFFGADGEAAEFSTLCQDDTDHYQQTRTKASTKVSVKTLTEILERNQCPGDFGILSIDTEGLDYEILQGLDFSRFRPRLIITEDFKLLEKDRLKYALLRANGYVLVKQRQVNSIWVCRPGAKG